MSRHDVAFTVKELASRMSNPTAMSCHRLENFLGYLKRAMDYCLVVEVPQAYAKKGEIGAWRHSQTQIGVGTKATESQHQEGSMH